MKVIGITGPTGAGKTTALGEIEKLGGCVLDADAVYHQLLGHDPALQGELEARFGPLRDKAGQIDRKKLGNVVFRDPAALADLNAITHRFIGEEIDRQLSAARAEGRSAAAIDAIALIESGLGDRCDAVVGVIAPAELRVRRIMVREGIPEDYAWKRVNAQQGEEFFRAHCDYLLENTERDTPDAFMARALVLFSDLLS